jgi:hypothetical protein
MSHGQVDTRHKNPDQLATNETPERSLLPSHPVIVSKLFKSCVLVEILGMPEERGINFLQVKKHVQYLHTAVDSCLSWGLYHMC